MPWNAIGSLLAVLWCARRAPHSQLCGGARVFYRLLDRSATVYDVPPDGCAGMRAVIAVLRAAGNLKRKFADEKEDVLMLRAISDVNLPKFLDEDVPLFQGILGDLFPSIHLPAMHYSDMTTAFIAICRQMHLQVCPVWQQVLVVLYGAMVLERPCL